MGVDRRRYLLAAAGENPNKVFAAYTTTGNILYGSSDAGGSWKQVLTNVSKIDSNAIDACGNAFVYNTSAVTIKTNVTGSSILVSSFATATGPICCSSGSEYCFMAHNVYNNNAAEPVYSVHLYNRTSIAWYVAKTFNTWDKVAAIACSEDGKYVCAGGGVGFTNGFVSKNQGATWTETLATSSYGNGTWDVDMSNDGYYTLIGTQGGLNRSVNALTSFTHDNNSDVRAVAVSGDGMLMFYSPYTAAGTVYISTNRGTSWTVAGSIGKYINRLVCSRTGKYLLAHTSDNILYRSVNFGTNWTQIKSAVTSMAMCKSFKR